MLKARRIYDDSSKSLVGRNNVKEIYVQGTRKHHVRKLQRHSFDRCFL